MWNGWPHLDRASALAEMPHTALPLTFTAIQMMYATDLQWDRLQASLDAPRGAVPVVGGWPIEAHFFLVAAANARDRLTVWAEMLDDDDARGFATRLDNPDVKTFRDHQEHLEERMPGRKRQKLAELSAPGNSMVHLEGDGTAIVMNGLRDRRFLSFGEGEVDLAAAHASVIEVASDLFRWLQAKSRFPDVG